jgi:hypothetical protein
MPIQKSAEFGDFRIALAKLRLKLSNAFLLGKGDRHGEGPNIVWRGAIAGSIPTLRCAPRQWRSARKHCCGADPGLGRAPLQAPNTAAVCCQTTGLAFPEAGLIPRAGRGAFPTGPRPFQDAW